MKAIAVIVLALSFGACGERRYCWNVLGRQQTCCQVVRDRFLDVPEPTGPAVCETWKVKR